MAIKRSKKKDDLKNEGIGIVSIVIIIVVAAIGIYYFFSPNSYRGVINDGTINVPLEAPSPIDEHSKSNERQIAP